MDLGITGFKKHIIALNRLAAIAILPGTQELSPTIAQILQERKPKQSILLNYRKINNSSFIGLLDTHINTSAHKEVPINPTNIHTQQTLPIYTTPKPQPRSATHHRHPITNNLIRGPPPLHTDPHTNNGHPNQSSVLDTPNLEPQTSPASSIITTEPRTEIKGHAKVPTPSFLDKITPQYTESNARPRKRTAHDNISRTELPQTQHPSPQRWKGLHLHHKPKPRAHNATHKGHPTNYKGTTTL